MPHFWSNSFKEYHPLMNATLFFRGNIVSPSSMVFCYLICGFIGLVQMNCLALWLLGEENTTSSFQKYKFCVNPQLAQIW